MRFIAFCLLLLSVELASAQRFSSELWHKGFVVTVDQDTIRGSVKYNMETNVVLVSRNNVVQTYSSHKLFYFEIFDKLVENYRQFYSIPYEVKANYEVPVIFELLYEGPLSLLARESIVTETVNSNTAFYGGAYMQDVVSYAFFFLDKEGNMDYFSGRKSDLFVIMARRQNQVKNFIKKNRLDVTDTRDLIRVTAFYNSI